VETRHFTLSFYLADETLQAHETDASSSRRLSGGSGAKPQRVAFLRRSRAPSHTSASGFIELRDLTIGSRVLVHGIPVRIVSCEPSSRRLLDQLSAQTPEALGLDVHWRLGEDEECWSLQEETARQRAAEALVAQRRKAETTKALEVAATQLMALAAQKAADEAAAAATAKVQVDADEARVRAFLKARVPMGTTARAQAVDDALRRAQEAGIGAGGRISIEKDFSARIFGGLEPHGSSGQRTRRNLHNPSPPDTVDRVFNAQQRMPAFSTSLARVSKVEPGEYVVDLP